MFTQARRMPELALSLNLLGNFVIIESYVTKDKFQIVSSRPGVVNAKNKLNSFANLFRNGRKAFYVN